MFYDFVRFALRAAPLYMKLLVLYFQVWPWMMDVMEFASRRYKPQG
jgi:hypothetical protein